MKAKMPSSNYCQTQSTAESLLIERLQVLVSFFFMQAKGVGITTGNNRNTRCNFKRNLLLRPLPAPTPHHSLPRPRHIHCMYSKENGRANTICQVFRTLWHFPSILLIVLMSLSQLLLIYHHYR